MFFAGFPEYSKLLGKTRQIQFPEYTPLCGNTALFSFFLSGLNQSRVFPTLTFTITWGKEYNILFAWGNGFDTTTCIQMSISEPAVITRMLESHAKTSTESDLPSPASSYQIRKPGAELDTSDLNLIHNLLLWENMGESTLVPQNFPTSGDNSLPPFLQARWLNRMSDWLEKLHVRTSQSGIMGLLFVNRRQLWLRISPSSVQALVSTE